MCLCHLLINTYRGWASQGGVLCPHRHKDSDQPSHTCTWGGNHFSFFSTSSSLAGNSGCHTWVRRSSHKSSATHSNQCMQYCRVSRQWYGCQIFNMCTNVDAHGGCTDTVRESALKADWEKNPLPHQVLEPMSALHLAFQSDILPNELSLSCPVTSP